jgi:hypothetical protein
MNLRTLAQRFFPRAQARKQGAFPCRCSRLLLEPLENRVLPSSAYQLLNDGNLQQQVNGGPWITIDSNTSAYNVDSNGVLYELKTNGNLWQLAGNNWTWLDSGVGTLRLAPNNTMYELKTNGVLWQLAGGAWTFVDNGVNTINVDPNNVFYELRSNGAFWQYSGGTWSRIPQVSSFQMNASGFVAYQMQDSSGSIWYPSLPSTSISSGLTSWFVDASNHVWGTLSGVLYEYNGSTQMAALGTHVSNAAASGDGAYVFYQDGSTLYRITASNGSSATLDTSSGGFSVANNGTVYELSTADGGMYSFAPGSTTRTLVTGTSGYYFNSLAVAPNGDVFAGRTHPGSNIPSLYDLYSINVDGVALAAQAANNPIQFQVTSFGAVVAQVERSLGNGGWQYVLMELTAGVWQTLDSQLAFPNGSNNSFAVAPNGALYELSYQYVSGHPYPYVNLWRLDSNGWTPLDTSAPYVAVANDGTLVEGDTSGAWILNANGWTFLASGSPTLLTGWKVAVNNGGVSYFYV